MMSRYGNMLPTACFAIVGIASIAVIVGCGPGAGSTHDAATPDPVVLAKGPKLEKRQQFEKPRPERSESGDRVDAENHRLAGAAAGEERDDNLLKMKFIWCPPGEFVMGSPSTEIGVSGTHNEEETQVAVTLTRGFWLGRTEVTQGQWRALMGTNPWEGREAVVEGDDYPATWVTWDDAHAFCRTMSEKERRVYRLPSEAEWEYACRARSTSAFNFGDTESQMDEYAWYRQNTLGTGELFAHEVGRKKLNPWGLADMHGNVWEWCQDSFTEKLPGGSDPVVTGSGPERVRRGGSFPHIPNVCRSAFRDRFAGSSGTADLGFRVVLSRNP